MERINSFTTDLHYHALEVDCPVCNKKAGIPCFPPILKDGVKDARGRTICIINDVHLQRIERYSKEKMKITLPARFAGSRHEQEHPISSTGPAADSISSTPSPSQPSGKSS